MAKDKINLPSGMGGLVRYFDEYKSKYQLSPGHVVVLAVIIIAAVLLLNIFGSALF